MYWRYRFALWAAEQQVIEGLRIAALSFRSGVDDEKLLSRVASAVHLLATYDRKRFERIKRDLRCVFVYWIPGSWGGYFAPLALCLLDAAFVAAGSTTPELLAATIVHEAMHARLRKWGVGYGKSTARVERVCLQAELDFAAKLPDAALVREVAEATLAAPDGYYSSAERTQRHQQAYLEAVDRLPLPKWFRRLLHWRFQRRAARKGAA